MKIQNKKYQERIFQFKSQKKYEKLNHSCTIECMLIKFTEKKVSLTYLRHSIRNRHEQAKRKKTGK
jgi:hypothetical protein